MAGLASTYSLFCRSGGQPIARRALRRTAPHSDEAVLGFPELSQPVQAFNVHGRHRGARCPLSTP
eukprot:CAMPEP_0171123408 /NCGR_PEP_ID=MMETSP0766_2-20121228/107052_1 /TAXON_ID=439317 /ORGANISM="Gambierdiscus australes, Strain CAWD 149" /LENGTH=64 /DNA_ID=CAMNT_0011586277 /DNA_START=101 /DNA_END=291 /DNA_ORIENTATION=+